MAVIALYKDLFGQAEALRARMEALQVACAEQVERQRESLPLMPESGAATGWPASAAARHSL